MFLLGFADNLLPADWCSCLWFMLIYAYVSAYCLKTIHCRLAHLATPYLTLPYLTLPSGWAGCYTGPALRPYQFSPMRNPDVTKGHSNRLWSRSRRWSRKFTSHLAWVTCSMYGCSYHMVCSWLAPHLQITSPSGPRSISPTTTSRWQTTVGELPLIYAYYVGWLM